MPLDHREGAVVFLLPAATIQKPKHESAIALRIGSEQTVHIVRGEADA